MNWRRILLAGVAAGIFFSAVDFIGYGLILGDAYMRLTESGVILAEPRFVFLPLAFLLAFAIGIGLSFTYAAMRTRLGAGPNTALALGLVAFLLLLPSELFHGAWTHMTPEVVWGSVAVQACRAFGSSLVAGWLYRE